jgi:MFS family permease
MLTWYRTLNGVERLTLLACFAGWALDAMDNQIFNLMIPSLVHELHVSPGDVGLMASSALLASGVGGWAAGALSDRVGRVRVLQITVAWFSVGSLLCGFAEDFNQLFVFRTFQGFGFGGEWAAGAVLIGEISRPQYRATAVGTVQSGYSIGAGCAAGLFYLAFSLLPAGLAWRAVFFAGVLPAILIIFIRRSVKEPVRSGTATKMPKSKLEFLAIFRPPHLGATLLASLLSVAIQGASYVNAIWMPSLLRSERGFTVGEASLYFVLSSVGAFAGYLSSAVLADRIGRKGSFWIFTIGALLVSALLTLVPLNAPLTMVVAPAFGFFVLGVYSNFGPFLTELYPRGVRGSGQGFCYNFGRGVGAAFPALVGYLTPSLKLSLAMAVVGIASYSVSCAIIFFLTETKGKVLDVAIAEDDDAAAKPHDFGQPALRSGAFRT